MSVAAMAAIRAAGFFAQQKQRRAAQGIKRYLMSRGPQCCGPDLPVSPTHSDDRERRALSRGNGTWKAGAPDGRSNIVWSEHH